MKNNNWYRAEHCEGCEQDITERRGTKTRRRLLSAQRALTAERPVSSVTAGWLR